MGIKQDVTIADRMTPIRQTSFLPVHKHQGWIRPYFDFNTLKNQNSLPFSRPLAP